MQTLQTLPRDEVRQIMWRFADRFDIQMMVQGARSVARGPVAKLVANGERKTHDWTEAKNELLKYYDQSGITAAFMEPWEGGYIEGPKNLALALLAFELAWVDGGAATYSLAGNLALAPIHEKGTPEQKQHYMSMAAPAQPGEDRKVWRGAFALTEPLPYVGVDTNTLCGKVRVAQWEEGKEPMLQVEKRARFITNMGFANFVTAAVDTDDPRIKSSCMVILEETDEGTFDRGAPTQKLVHQLSSTHDPIFNLKVPASRIIGGYTIQDGVIVPNFSHGEVIDAVFHRTRIPVSLMTAAKLVSAVEPVIRYQRDRFRGGGNCAPGTPRFDLGLQQKEDALQRLLDVMAVGEMGSSLGFETARLFDVYDALEKRKQEIFAEKGLKGRDQLKVLRKIQQDAVELIKLEAAPEGERDNARIEELRADELVMFAYYDSTANVLCPACKLWTGMGVTMMREAVSLMGGYGLTEDCPGFLTYKWTDAQLEATYEGPESVQRRQLTITQTSEVFLAHFRQWIRQMKHIAVEKPGTGACTLATAMEMWLWSLEHLMKSKDANGKALYNNKRQGVTFAMADALTWLLGARSLIQDVLELEAKGGENPVVAEGMEGLMSFYIDLCHVLAARASGEVGRICAELVYGFNEHPAWQDGKCYSDADLDTLEGVMPGLACCAEQMTDVCHEGQGHPDKAGPCVQSNGLTHFARLRNRLDGCMTGARLAKDRAAASLGGVMIPEALDYPL